MKNVLLLTTGGTIASRECGAGLAPAIGADAILREIAARHPRVAFARRDLLRLDSSDVQPEDWQAIARAVFAELEAYDGIVVTHGTDTMAYTAAALSLMLRNLKRSVVLTGSQLPIEAPLSDAPSNLHTAVAAVEAGVAGVTVAFGGVLIDGMRAVKCDSASLRAFESVNAHPLARVTADGLRVYAGGTGPIEPEAPTRLEDALCPDVFLLKPHPGTRADCFPALRDAGVRGVVVEAYGAGGLSRTGRDLAGGLRTLTEAGIAVVVCTQCLRGRVDLTRYEIGRNLLAAGAIPAGDLTTEAAVVKLMWALARTRDIEGVAEVFLRSPEEDGEERGDVCAPREIGD
jgi:L-asparaginases, type I